MKKLAFGWPWLGLLLIGAAPTTAAPPTSTTPARVAYSFHWQQPPGKNLDFKLFLAPIRMAGAVGSTGEFKENKDLPVDRILPDHRLELRPGEQAVLYLVAKNNTKKTIRFFVVPHETKPPEASLGFNFRCLCYNHIYEVKPGKLWYRVMLLKTDGGTSAPAVSLSHRIIWHK